jgi:DNA-binding PadR family transcriptional regulator
MDQLNATAACVLGLLLLGPVPGERRDGEPESMTGWQISDTANRSLSRFWHVTRSQIYLELGRLEDGGLVETTGKAGPRASRPYRITDAGRQDFLEWLGEFAGEEPRDDQLRSPLLLTVFFGEFLPPENLLRVLQEYRPRYERQLEGFRRMQAELRAEQMEALPAAVLRRGIAYRELMVRWIDDLLADLQRLDD